MIIMSNFVRLSRVVSHTTTNLTHERGVYYFGIGDTSSYYSSTRSQAPHSQAPKFEWFSLEINCRAFGAASALATAHIPSTLSTNYYGFGHTLELTNPSLTLPRTLCVHGNSLYVPRETSILASVRENWYRDEVSFTDKR